ncbi:hypothetical protein HYPSUDRAFT_1084245 [Hypholoma sublateritium FD-334 SS-4]|uniref:N-acetyltransferase domain-containing protein n=1 Tax=Hypholoma sublateritium (strain FD-334 SS-4) TaxID=945553 RepID=A0A0D2L6W3_HYPSF|nr:hypothetical protein HYPSUDRAFT_1084245 [Hypholoma sublateritium FD-334 SS-4]
MSATIRHIRNPTGKDVDDCTEVLYEAFNRRYFFSGLAKNETFVKPCLRAHLMSGVIGGEIHVAEVQDVGIVGVAMWFGPQQKFMSTPEQRAQGWDDLMSKVGNLYHQWWDYFLKFISDMPEKYYGPGVQFKSYHLQLIGVHPEHQGGGVGTALFEFVELKAKAERRSVVLETMGESAVPFYRGLGYTVFGPETVKAAAEEGTFPGYWFQKKFS